MERFMMNLSANLVSLACIACAIVCLVNPYGSDIHPDAWGWFLFGAFLTHATYSFSSSGKSDSAESE